MTTRLDRIIKAVFPGWAEQRAIARNNLSVLETWGRNDRGYAGGNQSRDRVLHSGGRSLGMDEDSLARLSLDNLRLEAMDLYRNHPLCASGVDGIVKYLGHSTPQSRTAPKAADKTAAEKWDAEATDYFTGWFWNRADSRRNPGVQFGQLQDYVTMASWLSGDMAFVWTGDGFEPIEGERIETPTKLQTDKHIVRGVRRDGSKRWTHIYVCDRGAWGSVDRNNFTRVPMSSVLFCPWYWRADQVRGVPGLHSVVASLRDHEEIHQYTKNKVKHEAMLFTRERAGAVKNRPGSRILENSDGTGTEITDAAWGMRVRVNGEPSDFELMSGATPHAQYVPFLQYDGQLIAAGMGMPSEVLFHLFTNGSYTAQRTARMDFYHLLLDEHAWRVRVFCQRAWNIVITQAIADGRLPPCPTDARGYALFNEVSWSLPHMLEIDIGKETDAQKAMWQLGTGNLEQFANERQTTRDKLLAAKRGDIEAAMRVAAEINENHPDAGITWRDIVNATGATEKAVLAGKEAANAPGKDN